MMERLATIHEFAEVLGCSDRMARRLVEQKKVPSFRVGHQHRVRIEEALEALRAEAESR